MQDHSNQAQTVVLPGLPLLGQGISQSRSALLSADSKEIYPQTSGFERSIKRAFTVTAMLSYFQIRVRIRPEEAGAFSSEVVLG
jgi:hypothetical protein